MVLDDQELRQYLNAAADHASEPGFTVETLISRIRRRRARTAGLVSGLLLAAAGIAVAVPLALTGTNAPPVSYPSRLPFRPSFTVAVNGSGRVVLKGGPHRFTVTPGEKLTMNVAVRVPPHATVTALWLGITNGVLADGRHGPADMHPILAARPGADLGPGVHRFRLHWVVPTRLRAGTGRQLSVEWTFSQPPTGEVEQFLAELVTPRS